MLVLVAFLPVPTHSSSFFVVPQQYKCVIVDQYSTRFGHSFADDQPNSIVHLFVTPRPRQCTLGFGCRVLMLTTAYHARSAHATGAKAPRVLIEYLASLKS